MIHAGASDVIIGNNVTIGHGSVIHCARIGNTVLVGMHATLSNFSEIGDFSIVGAHSMVADRFKVPPGSLAVGAPARIKRSVTRKEINDILSGTHFYVGLAGDFKKRGL